MRLYLKIQEKRSIKRILKNSKLLLYFLYKINVKSQNAYLFYMYNAHFKKQIKYDSKNHTMK